MVFYPHVHLSNTTTKHISWKLVKPKYDNKIYKKCQILNLENEMKLKIKCKTFRTLFI